MKKCSDCHWQRIIDGPTMAAEGYTICTRTPPGGNGTGNCKGYARKRWLWFAWWIPKIILLALTLSGCSTTEARYEDGVATVKRVRFLMTEDIDSFSYDASDGSFTFDGYKSDMTRLIDLVDRLSKKDEERRWDNE